MHKLGYAFMCMLKVFSHSQVHSTKEYTHAHDHTRTPALTNKLTFAVHFTSWSTWTVGEVLAVCCRQHGRTDGSGAGPAVATAGDHGVWLWDPRALAAPVVRLGDGDRAQPAPVIRLGGGDGAQPQAQASGTASFHDDAAAKSCSAVCFHSKESHTVISAAESWVRWHDVRAPSVPIVAVQCCGGDDEVNDICVNDRGTHIA